MVVVCLQSWVLVLGDGLGVLNDTRALDAVCWRHGLCYNVGSKELEVAAGTKHEKKKEEKSVMAK